MDRRKFLHRAGASATVAAVSPFMGGIGSGLSAQTGTSHESSTGNPAVDERGTSGLTSLQTTLSKGFAEPPASAAPWVFWMWSGVETTPAAITYDLEQMKQKGIAGFILYGCRQGDIERTIPKATLVKKDGRFEYEFSKKDAFTDCFTTPIPLPGLQAWTPRWREHIRFVAKEAARLDLRFCLTLGLAGTSGQIEEKWGNQRLVWTETNVHGPAAFDGILPLLPPGRAGSSAPLRHKSEPGYHGDVAVLAVPDSSGFQVNQVVDLTSKMDASGRLVWNPPAGSWKILRFSHVPTLVHNYWGIFSDCMRAQALDKVWELTVAPLLAEMSPEERKGLVGIEDDSWEAGICTWTEHFPEEFKRRRGYDLSPYLPILTNWLADRETPRYNPTPYQVQAGGVQMLDPVVRERVQRDYELTVADLIAEQHYGHLERLCRKNDLLFHSEAAGPHLFQADLLKTTSSVDLPMAEFWMPCYHRPTPDVEYLARNAASASHVYGMPINMDEAFTSMGPEWEEGPFDMKPVGDRAFCDGINRMCIHNFSHSPSRTAKPGYVYVPGTHYDPGITWWEQVPAFNTYLARCSYMLQQGHFVADALFYGGDNIGAGEPMKVVHPTLGEGYDYDWANTDVLLNRISVNEGRIVLPDGMSYRVLILPENQPMAFNGLQKVARMIEAGATVVGPPPSGLSGMPKDAEEEDKFKALVTKLWGSSKDGPSSAKRRIGRGYLVAGQSARQTLQDAGVPPDFEQSGLSSSGEIYWIHRKTRDTDIYFVSSHWKPVEKLECSFRVSGKQPELWDPVTGKLRDAPASRQEGAYTILPLEFDPCGSTFVVFRKSIGPKTSGYAVTNYSRSARIDLKLSGAWDVSFDPRWGGPKEVVLFDSLVDWTSRQEPEIRYYSGTAIYRKTFDLVKRPSKGSGQVLDLGEVHELASVRLNGRDLGVVWTKPAHVDVSNLLKRKGNLLEVTVVNLWPNRLIRDAALPPEARLTATNVHKFNAHSPLLPSGLIGPVMISS